TRSISSTLRACSPSFSAVRALCPSTVGLRKEQERPGARPSPRAPRHEHAGSIRHERHDRYDVARSPRAGSRAGAPVHIPPRKLWCRGCRPCLASPTLAFDEGRLGDGLRSDGSSSVGSARESYGISACEDKPVASLPLRGHPPPHEDNAMMVMAYRTVDID